MSFDYTQAIWFSYLDASQRELVEQAYQLLESEEGRASHWTDYAFVVFPMAKAYEGFLKKFFYDLEIIDDRLYTSTFFRIGKSLNPDLPNKYRDDEWLVGRLDEKCPLTVGDPLSRVLWKTWKEGRNLLFHYFPGSSRKVTLVEAARLLEQFSQAMRGALTCPTFIRGAK